MSDIVLLNLLCVLLTVSIFTEAASLSDCQFSSFVLFQGACDLVPAVVIVSVNVEDFLAFD